MTLVPERYKKCEPYENIKVGYFTARLFPRLLRNVHNELITSVLTRDLTEQDTEEVIRSHTWIKVCKKVKSIINDAREMKKKEVNVLIRANLFIYISSEGKKIGIRHIKSIKIID